MAQILMTNPCSGSSSVGWLYYLPHVQFILPFSLCLIYGSSHPMRLLMSRFGRLVHIYHLCSSHPLCLCNRNKQRQTSCPSFLSRCACSIFVLYCRYQIQRNAKIKEWCIFFSPCMYVCFLLWFKRYIHLIKHTVEEFQTVCTESMRGRQQRETFKYARGKGWPGRTVLVSYAWGWDVPRKSLEKKNHTHKKTELSLEQHLISLSTIRP